MYIIFIFRSQQEAQLIEQQTTNKGLQMQATNFLITVQYQTQYSARNSGRQKTSRKIIMHQN